MPILSDRSTVLVVDDTAQNLALMRDMLQERYNVKLAPSGDRALKIANSAPPDLILLDVMMPVMNGYEVCERLKADPHTRDIPVIFLTALDDQEAEHRCLTLGAADFISKPIRPLILEARVRNQIVAKQAADLLRDHTQQLEAEVARRTADLVELQDVTILTMASLAETRDNETGNHLKRTQSYVQALARHLSHSAEFSELLTPATIELLMKSAPLHDIGKVGVPDHILLKPGRLSADEFEIMKQHTTMGRDVIESAEARLGKSVPFLQFAKEIAYSHQEKWDGTGYPLGLAGQDIPLSARLMALADVYDALISRRVYKPAFSHETALEIISKGRGQHFDPTICDAFLAIHPQFHAIAVSLGDENEVAPAAL
jgi:putative two-component system response regulator